MENPRTLKQRALTLSLGLASLVLASLLLLLQAGLPRQGPAFLFLWLIPGIAWSLALSGKAAERLVMGAGIAFAANVTSTLLASYLPGPVRPGLLLIASLIVTFSPLLISFRVGRWPQETQLPKWSKESLALVFLLLMTIFFRFTNMGYKEIQGDEGIILVRAAAAITGDESSLFLHQKGPVEILIPLTTWSLTGEINDAWARLPFTWISAISVLAIFALGRAWIGTVAGLMAAMLMALNGFSIAFGRIIQYQSLVMVWGVLALLAAVRYRQRGRVADLLLASVFCSSAILAHYDGLLFAVPVIWEVLSNDNWRKNLRHFLLAAGIGLAHLALFYGPYLLGPSFANTIDYLVNDRIGATSGGAPVGWSGFEVWRMLTFYNSTWYVLVVGCFALIGLGVAIRRKRATLYGLVLTAAVPAFFYLFVVTDPRTHVYTIFPGFAILGGLGIWRTWQGIQSWPKPGKVALGLVGLFTVSLIGLYPYLLFVDVTPERQRTWAENRPNPALFWTSWEEPPQYGLFGFPHQAGWRAAGQILAQVALPYASNEEREITSWYMAQAARTHCRNFETLIITENAQDALPIDDAWLENMRLTAQVSIGQSETMRVYGRTANGETNLIDASKVDRWLSPKEIAPPKTTGSTPVNVELGSSIMLLGYDLDLSEAIPGGRVVVILYWQALEPIDRNYQVFVHLVGDTQFAQHDGAPECAVNPTTRWEPGNVIVDPHIIELPLDFQPQTGRIFVGMYDLLTETRLPIDDNPDDALPLTEIRILSRE